MGPAVAIDQVNNLPSPGREPALCHVPGRACTMRQVACALRPWILAGNQATAARTEDAVRYDQHAACPSAPPFLVMVPESRPVKEALAQFRSLVRRVPLAVWIIGLLLLVAAWLLLGRQAEESTPAGEVAWLASRSLAARHCAQAAHRSSSRSDGEIRVTRSQCHILAADDPGMAWQL